MIGDSPRGLYSFHGLACEGCCPWSFHLSVLLDRGSRLVNLFDVVRVLAVQGLMISDAACLHAPVLLRVPRLARIDNVDAISCR